MGFRLTLIQMKVESEDVRENLDHAEALLERAASFKPDLVCLPEIFNASVYYDRLAEVGERPPSGVTSDRARQWAKRFGAAVVAGSIVENDGGKFYNASPVYDPRGRHLGTYRKIHLFSPEGEDRHFAPGTRPEIFRHNGCAFGVMICYDLRFGALTEFFSAQGARLVLVPARFPAVRRDHWTTLLKARAIERQMFVAGANAVGVSATLGPLGGASAAYDPWGVCLGSLDGENEGVLNVEIDLGAFDEARRRIPVDRAARPDLYRTWR